jgi:hypothetical protein
MKMSKISRKELVRSAKGRYLKSNKKEKKKILDELEENSGMHRKYLVSLLSSKKDLDTPMVINRKRKETYSGKVILALKKIWEIFDYPCGTRLKPMLPEYVSVLLKWKEISLSEKVKEKLLKISSATIDRRLKRTKEIEKRKIFSTTKPGTLLKSQIPIKTSSWDEKRSGFGELDTVAHCGSSASGEFIFSLTYTDIATQWTESMAVMGKGQRGIVNGLGNIARRLPFDLLGIDPDNGSEFINWQLYKHCMGEGIEFTRGRPYKKNDNAHIEQKNWTHVRKLCGYKRFDMQEQLEGLNDLYQNEWRLYKNFFQPNKKLIEKKRVDTKIVKRYDVPRTPYQRVLETSDVSEEKKEKLRTVYENLNPAELKRRIDRKISKM